jgi:probable HAF family extracellular repeat protein
MSTRNQRLARVRATAALALAISASRAVAAVEYSVLDLGTLGGIASEGYGLNDSGQVVGFAKDLTDTRFAFRTASNSAINPLTDNLGVIGSGTRSFAYSINSAGQITGDTNPGGEDRAFRFSGGTMTSLGTLGGNWSYGFGINEFGAVVGGSAVSNSPNSDTRAFLHNGTAMTNLGSLGGPNGYARSINVSGVVAGYSQSTVLDNGYNAEHAFRWTPATPNGTTGTMTDLGTLGGNYSFASAINDAGYIVGAAGLPGDSPFVAFVHNGITMTSLGSLAGTYSEAFGINNRNEIVGTSNSLAAEDHAFVYKSGAIQDLNDLIPLGTGWILEEAHGINSFGQIVGFGIAPNGETHAFSAHANLFDVERHQRQLQRLIELAEWRARGRGKRRVLRISSNRATHGFC